MLYFKRDRVGEKHEIAGELPETQSLQFCQIYDLKYKLGKSLTLAQ